jgi:hypothetical protein
MSTLAHTAAFRARNAEQDARVTREPLLCTCGLEIPRGTMGGARHNAKRVFCSEKCRDDAIDSIVRLLRDAGVVAL